jgi:hypothetical protein
MIDRLTAACLALAVLAIPAYAENKPVELTSPSAEEIRQADAKSEEEWYYSVGLQNYVFTLPLTMLERE